MPYPIRDQGGLYFLTFTVVNWIDVFTRPVYKDIVIGSLRYCQAKKGLELFAFCLMTNHLHLIGRVREGGSLSDLVRDFKKFTSQAIFREIQQSPRESRQGWLLWLFTREGERNPNNLHFQVWQQHSHAVELTSNTMIQQRLDYTHQNPVRAGICYRPEDYVYSSAAQYAGLETVLPVSLVG
ncbi:transposase [Hymenobacter fastidiosus]|uniref:Transposase n=1 Tax=Hymenobacter fastidiosus TaxID=486264 RepID=A0ABP7SEQ1_9BACT